MATAFGCFRHLVRIAFAAIPLLAKPALAAEPLPSLGVDESRTTVSGLSSGAYMAGQFQIAYSKLVTGAALVAGGPYGCAKLHNWYYRMLSFSVPEAQRNVAWALAHCMEDDRFYADGTAFLGVPTGKALAAQARALAGAGRIDDISGVASDKIYLFSSSRDETVKLPIMERAEAFYKSLGVAAGNIAFVKNDRVPHAFVTENQPTQCEVANEAFITQCDYNQAKAVLDILYPSSSEEGAGEGQLLPFDQRPFLPVEDSGMAEDGKLYVPQSCTGQAGCAVHVVFHGCRQDSRTVHERFIRESGFLAVADRKGIVLLFPRIEADRDENPKGCWDWWGYTAGNFLERDAPQMLAVRRMVARLAERGS